MFQTFHIWTQNPVNLHNYQSNIHSIKIRFKIIFEAHAGINLSKSIFTQAPKYYHVMQLTTNMRQPSTGAHTHNSLMIGISK